MLGLVLTAGGARGAYQAGVLKRIGESPVAARRAVALRDRRRSVGGRDQRRDGRGAERELPRGDPAPRATLGRARGRPRLPHRRAVARTDGGGLAARPRARRADRRHGDAVAVRRRSARGARSHASAAPTASRPRSAEGNLYAVAISATSYHSGRSFTFVQGRAGHPVWIKSRRVVLPVELTVEPHLRVGRDPDRVPAGARSARSLATSSSATAALRLVDAVQPRDPSRRHARVRDRHPLAARGRRALARRAGRRRGGGRRRVDRLLPAAGADLRRLPERDLPRPPRQPTSTTCGA